MFNQQMMLTWLVSGLILLCVQMGVSQGDQSKPCVFYNDDTGQVVTNYTSVTRLKVDCSSKGLYTVPDFLPPNTFKLYLKENFISRISSYAFSSFTNITLLDLSNNKIDEMDPNSFRHLHALETLNLAGNQLCLPADYPKGIFRDLTSLKTLKTFSNTCPSLHNNYPDDVFEDLTSLEHLSLDVTVNFTFGQGFKKLTKLIQLEASALEGLCESYKLQITKETFIGLSNSKISDLTLRGCAFRKISNESFNNFPYLKALNLACARNLDHKSPFDAIHTMRNATLETLILDGTFTFGKSSILNTIIKAAEKLDSKLLVAFLKRLLEKLGLGENLQPFCHPNFSNLRRLSLRANTLAYKIKFHKDGVPCTPYLHHLNIGMNPMFYIAAYVPKGYVHGFITRGIPVENYWSYTNIRTIDISGLFSQWYYFDYPFCSGDHLNTESYFEKVPKVVENVPDFPNFNVSSGYVKSTPTKNGTDLHGVKSVMAFQYVSPGTQVLLAKNVANGIQWVPSVIHDCPYIVYPVDTAVYINATNNNVSFMDCPILGIKSLKALDGSYCQVTSFHEDLLKRKYVPLIELLYLRGNKLKSTKFPEIFDEAISLREIDLSGNDFQTLPYTSFKNLVNLEKLDLSNNMLSSADLLISNMTKLNILDLSINTIPYLSVLFQEQLEIVSKHSPKFKLNLQGNPLTCDCDSLQFLNWVKETKVTIEHLKSMVCVNKNSSVLGIDTVKMAEECNVSYLQYYVIIGSMSTFIILVVITSVTAYRQRWKIAWHMYIFRRKLLNNKHKLLKEADADKIFDAHVEYHVEDDIGLPWVTNKLVPYVERQWGKKLYIIDRDTPAGTFIINLIIYGLEKSRKVIFVLTETYLKKGYWQMVLYRAERQGLNNIIMCCLGDLKINKLPKSLAQVAIELQKRYPTHYLKFSLQDNDDVVWTHLREALEEPVDHD